MPPGVSITWVARDADGSVGRAAALRGLRRPTSVDASGYAFIVREPTRAQEGRRHLNRLGRPKDRITFSGFRRHAAPAQPRCPPPTTWPNSPR
ncbi:SIP domain-containing protein [Streptomyces aureus]|uniref:SIP domain-containing protein n=1 Tax=Streptomyces aureus TaxID=193461 RepID=UPI00367AA2B2